MPNHVANEIKIIGPEEQVARFFEQAKVEVDGEIEVFSFRGFVAPPDHPDYTSGGCSHQHPLGGLFFGKKDEHPNCWYPWNTKNWGTKWDAYQVQFGGERTILDRIVSAGSGTVEETVRFDTAWSPPFPVFEAMAEHYPDCKFEFRWMDEDSWGSGGGYASAENGVYKDGDSGINDPNDPSTGHIWRQLMFMRGYDPASLDDYIEEVEEQL